MNQRILGLLSVVAALTFSFPASVSAAEGPYLVKDLRADGPSNPRDLIAVGSRVFFTADDGIKGRELYVSDGTSDGTRRVKDIWAGAGSANPSQLTLFGDRLIFVARDGVNGPGLYITDGTFGGTRRIIQRQACGTGGIEGFLVTGGLLYLARYDSDPFACNLYATDGTAAGTHLIASNIPGFDSPTAYDGRIYFSDTTTSHLRLWKTAPATLAGFKLVKNFGLGSSLSEMTASGRFLFLAASAHDLDNERVLWRSDGTKAGTKIVNSADGPVESPASLTDVGGVLMFSALRLENDTVVDPGLWRSNGKIAGTRLIKEFTEPEGHGPQDLGVIGDRLFFITLHHVEPDTAEPTLWRSDGTISGTVALLDPGKGGAWVALGDAIFFGGQQLLMTDTDGAPVTTLPGVVTVRYLTAAQTSVFFAATGYGAQGIGELYRYVP